MFQLIKSTLGSINNLIVKSITTDEVSATRLSSYMILAPIQMMIIVVILIEMTAFIHAMFIGKDYVLSNEFIITFGMVLSHHLAILFSRSKSQSRAELRGNNNVTSNTTDVTDPVTTDSSTTNQDNNPTKQ